MKQGVKIYIFRLIIAGILLIIFIIGKAIKITGSITQK
jgi:hypothetical protein